MTGAPATLYPQYCFDLAPTSNTWCLLDAASIHDLDSHPGFEGQNVYFHGNLPIKWIRIVGVVVAIDDFPGRRVYTVDDSSGACIECNVVVKRCALTEIVDDKSTTSADAAASARARARASLSEPRLEYQQPGCENVDVGSVVDVKGSVALFRDEKTVKIEKVRVLRSTEEEVALWERRAAFRRDVLSKPWVLTEKQVRRCRREAEGMDEWNRKREEREKKRAERRGGGETETAGKTTTVPYVNKGSYGLADAAEIEVDGFARPKRPKNGRAPARHEHQLQIRDSSGERSSRVGVEETQRGKYSALGL
ncbi:hypothetical protein SODALDRAFT_352553 [Sodiomyces alkalinus F11]|uniref:CST complex subunit Stn1 N-terminal domain-containing protein n=1 Tax=Sodiomyces alkalinus (strain CBS 110278 / VKM F-3762 / F11) TaxID=1314773 RepID=A0A3N2PQ27_SODAK|nr:hypothetical protein SODALDRAFT_352553 [Sodiomyces alkalinus F11]ROT36609.1 hypothetical protein SODALDRAFT_352553 [Sodiomyces alkalinus F11]